MGGAHSRRKGAQGERELVNLAKAVGLKDAKREAPMQAGHGDDYPDVGGIAGLYIESKRYKKTPVNTFAEELLNKVRRDALLPVLMYRDDGCRWRAVLDGETMLKLWRELSELRGAVHMVCQGSGKIA